MKYILQCIPLFVKQEFSLPTHNGKSVIESHHHRNFSIVPQNRLGQEIFVRAVESRGLSDIIGLLPGDTKLVKVPVLRNMVDAHPRGSSRKVSWVLMTVVVCDAEVVYCSVPGLFYYQNGK